MLTKIYDNYKVTFTDPEVFVDNFKRRRSGHMTHAMTILQDGRLLDFNSSCSAVRWRACSSRRAASSHAAKPSPISKPLTAPMVTPSKKYFCRAKNRMNMGSADSVAPAIMGANRVSLANLKVFKPT